MNVPDDLRALVGRPVPEGLGGPAQTRLGDRRAFAWFEGEDVRVIGPPDGSDVWVVTVEHPDFAGTPDEVLAELGEPDSRADTALGTVRIPGGEWAYPERGLTVFADEEDERVFRVALYAPGERLSLSESVRRQPSG